jgi:hypothetical protein
MASTVYCCDEEAPQPMQGTQLPDTFRSFYSSQKVFGLTLEFRQTGVSKRKVFETNLYLSLLILRLVGDQGQLVGIDRYHTPYISGTAHEPRTEEGAVCVVDTSALKSGH